jgi:hypothetical protein
MESDRKSQEKKASRPRSVTILAWLQILQSLGLLGYGGYLVDAKGWTFTEKASTIQFIPLALFDWMTNGVILVVLGACMAIVSLALFRLRSWAWLASMALQGAGLFAGLIGYIYGSPNYFGMILGTFIVLYLNRQEVQAAFRVRV